MITASPTQAYTPAPPVSAASPSVCRDPETGRLEAGAALLRFFQSRWQQGGEYRASIETILADDAILAGCEQEGPKQ